MINKDFIAGLAIGALRNGRPNTYEQEYLVEWVKTEGFHMLRIKFAPEIEHFLDDLYQLDYVLGDFCKVTYIKVGVNVDIYIKDEDDGKQLAD